MDLAVAPNYPWFLRWLETATEPPLSVVPSQVRFVHRPDQLQGSNGNTIYVINGGPNDEAMRHAVEARSVLCTVVYVSTLPLDIAGSVCYTAATGTTRE